MFGRINIIHQNVPNKKHTNIHFPEHILFIPLQGEISLTIDSKIIKLGPGQMLYVPPDLKHSFSSSENFGERLIVLIEKSCAMHLIFSDFPVALPLNQLVKELMFYLLLHPKTKNAKGVTDTFLDTLSEIFEDVSKNQEFLINHAEGKVTDSRVKSALEYMKDNLDSDLTMDVIAKKSGLSTRNLNRIFTNETGLQPKQWLISYRIEKAKELLKIPKSSVTEVAFSVGYNSLGQFISAFRAKTGQLPSEFQRRG